MEGVVLTSMELLRQNWTFVYERLVFAASGKFEISTNGRYGLGNFWPVKSTNWEGGDYRPLTKLASNGGG